MTTAKDAVGDYGERVAVRLLLDAGMRIVDRNWRCERGELDIVAVDRAELVFCEVKTRRGEAFGAPAEAVGRVKQRRLRRLAAQWLEAHPEYGGDLRFDVVSVWPSKRGKAVTEHLRGAF